MNQYIYSPTQAGLAEWPSGTLRLEGIPVTENPDEADVFVIPGSLLSSNPQLFPNRAALEKLPFFARYESKHVAFDCSDYETLYDTSAMLIRCNTRDWYLGRDPNTISFCWPVEDFGDCIPVPEGGFNYDVSFHGWRSSVVRQQSIDSARACQRADVVEYLNFYGYVERDSPVEAARRRAEYKRSMKESRIALCPESIAGVFPYRFFEAMSAGRVPLLVGSHYVLPFADEIPYGEFTMMLQADEADKVADCVAAVVQQIPDEKFVEMGRLARHYWETWLHRDKWPALMAYAVEKRVRG